MDIRNPHFLAFAAAERQFLESEYDDYAIASSGSLACFRYVAIIVSKTCVMLLRFSDSVRKHNIIEGGLSSIHAVDATLADSPNIDGHKGLFNGAGLIYILQRKLEL